MPTPNCTGENVPGSFSFKVAHDGRADELMEDGSYGNGPYATIFLGYGNQPSTKKYGLRCSGMNLWLAAILFLHSLQMALTASEFICLMISALHPSASAALFSFAFLTDHLKSAEVNGLCAWGEESPCILSNESGIIGESSCEWSSCSF